MFSDITPQERPSVEAFVRLGRILDILRKQCSWDSVQTIASLRYLTIEEVYELSDAILQLDQSGSDADSNGELKKELGDIFMHLMFYAKIADDEHRFTLADVLHSIGDKLVSRHPHISLPDREGTMQGGPHIAAPEWEKVKMKEGRRSVLEGVPSSTPSLVKAQRMQEKAMGVGFRFPSGDEALGKVREEYQELVDAIADNEAAPSENHQAHVVEEFGDLMFALTVWSHFIGVNADEALSLANQKFKSRFTYVESRAASQGTTVDQLSLQDMRALWKEAKSRE